MIPIVLDALYVALLEPPKPEPHRPASGAFQRRLAEQRAAQRSESGREAPRRPAESRTTRQSARVERGPRAGAGPGPGAAPDRQGAASATLLAPGGFDGASSGGGKGGGQGGLSGGAAPVVPPVQEIELDCAMLLDLLPSDGEGGIFELLLPGGERLGVVADLRPRQASFLLTPSSERLRKQLNGRKMELEKGLAQRMDRHVRLTVL